MRNNKANMTKWQAMKAERDKRAKFLGVVLTIILLVLCYRILHVQIVRGEDYRAWAAAQQASAQRAGVTRTIPAARGGIMDRHMQPLASSIPIFEVFMDVNMLHRGRHRNRDGNNDFYATIEALHRHLNIPSIELLGHFNTNAEGNLLFPTYHRILSSEVDATTAIYLRDNFAHVHATERSLRFYHDPFFAPQVIGFIRGDGIWGLEAFYHDTLMGTPGRVFLLQGEQEEVPVRHGHTLVTTLDSEIQQIAQNIVNQTFQEMDAEFVAKIVMDPFTGEILAMAQAPTFSIIDPFNPFATTDIQLQEHWDDMAASQQVTEMQRMWRNFHTTRSYEPGSIFKPIVIAAAIEEGVLSPYDVFFCNGIKHIVAGVYLPCWTFPFSSHGRLTLTEAIYRSCNVAMFYIAEMMGLDIFYRYRGYFGFGERTGIDLPAEEAVSSRAVMYARGDLGPVQRATSSMGQGFNATTLQSITAYAALINGGNLLQPFIVSQVVDSFGNVVYERQPTITRRVISPQTSDFIRTQMQYVVSAPGGTAHQFSRIPGHTIGGKTGTGQQGRDDGINSLTYIAFTPVENPEFLVLMVIDRVCDETYGGAGREVGPRVRRFFEEVITLRGLQPSDGPDAQYRWEAHALGTDIMPDYSGQRLVDAVLDLSNRGNGGFQVVGVGTRISHTIPAPGRPMPQNSPVFFHMDPNTRIEGQMTIVPDVTGLTVSRASELLRDVGLPPILISSATAPMGTGASAGSAEGTNGQTQMLYIVYQQFPLPGTEMERGTRVMLRAS